MADKYKILLIKKDLQLGSLVKIFMKNGTTFNGSLKYIDDYIVVKAINGDLINIYNIDEIVAIQYSKTKDNIVKEKNQQDEKPNYDPKDIKSLVALKRMQAEEEVKEIKNNFTSNSITREPITYESQLSSLLIAKDNTRK